MRLLTDGERVALKFVAEAVSVPRKTLAAEIDNESRWNPQAKNPKSSARGLLQFLDLTAKLMGYYGGSAQLVAQHPTAEAQLRGPVLAYLRKRAPFPTDQSLFMAVFYPAARTWPLEKEFPMIVQDANPGIVTVGDYVKHVWARVGEITDAELEPATMELK